MTAVAAFLAAHGLQLAIGWLSLATVGMLLPGLIVRLGKDER